MENYAVDEGSDYSISDDPVGGKQSEHPTFPTNIFDGREEAVEPEDQEDQTESRSDRIMHWFWFFSVLALFFGGVAISYYIIHH